jgi:MinD-like ATPase involved in chromosome partitioning or flagellar assembly
LSDLLREKNAIEELPLEVLVKKTAVPRLYLLPSGTCTDNIFGLLCSGRLARLLPRFRQEFDYVLVDAPPCLEFADARIMGRYAEKLLLVVRADYTDRNTAQAAVQRLLLDGIPVMGVIFNYWDPAHRDIYDYAFARISQEFKRIHLRALTRATPQPQWAVASVDWCHTPGNDPDICLSVWERPTTADVIARRGFWESWFPAVGVAPYHLS